MPLHYMQVLRLPAWLLKHLDRIRRNFFWKGNEKCLGGHCLVAWRNCCLPKKIGGIGILNLDCQNQALLQKWLWKLLTEPESLWTKTINLLYGTSDVGQLSSLEHISHCLKDILEGSPFMKVSIAQNSQDDRISWRWTSDGNFSSASAYKILSDAGLREPILAFIWKIKVPTKVKLFIWLLLKDKILTQSNLQKRNWPSISNCILCQSSAFEDREHLFIECTFAKTTWSQLMRANNFTWHDNLLDLWVKNRRPPNRLKPILWDSTWAAGCWLIWKERNSRIFNNRSSTSAHLASGIAILSRQWFLNC